MKKPKDSFKIDCPLCSIHMRQANVPAASPLEFNCHLCGTITIIPRSKPYDRHSKYREEMLEQRRDK